MSFCLYVLFGAHHLTNSPNTYGSNITLFGQSSSRRLTEQCSMTLLKVHKLCNALRNARDCRKNLKQRRMKSISGSRENVYICPIKCQLKTSLI